MATVLNKRARFWFDCLATLRKNTSDVYLLTGWSAVIPPQVSKYCGFFLDETRRFLSGFRGKYNHLSGICIARSTFSTPLSFTVYHCGEVHSLTNRKAKGKLPISRNIILWRNYPCAKSYCVRRILLLKVLRSFMYMRHKQTRHYLRTDW